ncbi:protein farnesyltransferase subunit beta isoform X2 [Hydra vulgaris]|uniref:Protein farnesyltransferase subunit beta n=1 Tax=Hydra vulgaris TaxID=6087 RepID=A0ABM4C1G9_HYDVU
MVLKRGIFLLKDDGFITHTTEEQRKVEKQVLSNYENVQDDKNNGIKLLRSKHISYLKKGLLQLSDSYECLDASRPWLCYWILHSLELLNEPIPEEVCQQVANFLDKCQNHDTGGFGGGPGQLSHLAPTYAAVCSLCILGKYWLAAYDIINREKLQKFLTSCRTVSGSFIMHHDGEEDIRGVYCAMVAARLTNVFTKEMFKGTADWLASCQTYEGGFGGLPGLEAHGGYTFCGYASLALLGQEQKARTKQLLKWVAFRQMKLEGGFQGRTNKLVDGCYSFWQGGMFPVIHSILQMYSDENLSNTNWMFDQSALEEYILVNCQWPQGGLIDKPGKSRDFYHTCYCLSGLSVAEHFIGDEVTNTHVEGRQTNLLQPIHPIFNICIDSANEALLHFNRLAVPSSD